MIAFKTACRNTEVPEDISDAFKGRSNSNVGRMHRHKIGRRDSSEFLAVLKRHVDRIRIRLADSAA